MPSSNPTERSIAASIASNISWAQTKDRSKRTANGRRAFEQRFLDAADGDPARARNLRNAYFKRLALKSVQARRRITDNGVGSGAAR